MRLAPRIERERGADGVLRLSLDDVRHPVLVGERPTENDEPRVHETVHESRVRGPARLLLQRPRRIPLRPCAENHDEERRHGPFLAHG